jgi:hypothetical protein
VANRQTAEGEKRRLLGYLLLASVLIATVGLTAGMVSTWSAGQAFGPTGNYISELSVGPGIAPAAFPVMILGLATFSGAFFVLAPERLGAAFSGVDSAARVGRVFGVVGSAALIVLVFFPLDAGRPSVFMTHVALAAVAFFATSGETAAYAFVLRRSRGVLRWARRAAVLCSPFTFAFGALVLLVEVGGFIPAVPFVYVIEWLAFLFFALWILLTGLGLVRSARNSAGTSATSR